MMANLTVRLFGRFSVQWDGRPLAGFESAKAQELFSYLLLQRGRRFPRETLGSLLWPEGTPAQCRKYLRQALWQVQSALEPLAAAPDAALIRAEGDWLAGNPEAPLDLDVAAVARAAALVQATPGPLVEARVAAVAADAVQRYAGDLLEGWYQDWCLFERERLQLLYLALLDRLTGHCERERQYAAGIAYAARILQLDHAQERAHRRLMRLYCLAGDRTAALRQFDRCRAALREELGVEPGKRTTALRDQIAADLLAPLAPGANEGAPARPADARLSGLHDRLTRLQQALTTLRDQVIEDVRAVELALRDDDR